MRSLDSDRLTDLSHSRPGMGYSTDVPLRQRLNTWIELVPYFLAHLKIEHVTLASHSAGTIYLLNTLIRCRNILHPITPLVFLIGMILILPINAVRR